MLPAASLADQFASLSKGIPVLFQGSMKISVSKIAAAKSQLLEAINLFFEERDPISTCDSL